MNPGILIRHLGGSAVHLAGAVQEFELDRIRLGRATDCELRFDPVQDRGVSTVHAEILRVDEGFAVVDCGSRNGVFVNGQRVEQQSTLANGDRLQLGADGPLLEVVLAGEALATETAYLGVAPETELRQGTSARASKKSIGMKTLIGVVDQTVKRERQRARRVLLPVIAVSLASVVAILLVVNAEPMEWRDVLAVPTQSVYVCARVTNGNAHPFGSAWSLGNGCLATNSHVAAEFAGLRKDQQFVVRSCTTPPQDLRITRVTLHPAYERWSDLVNRYSPFVAGQGFQRMLPPAFDVALLHVHEDDVGLLAPALTVASRQELLDIKPGDAVALVGYPMESQAGSGVNMDAPYPQLRAGTVSRTTDYFLGTDVAAKRHMIGMNLSSAGGASGSPVFDRNGHVVAVNSAGDYFMLANNKRIGSGGAYGQRADVLLDLIEGKAAGADAVGNDLLEAEFLRRFRKGVADPDPFAFWLATQALKSGESLAEAYKLQFEISKAGPDGAVILDGHEAPADGEFVRIVFPLNLPVVPLVSTLNLIAYRKDETMFYFLLDRWTRKQGSRSKTKVEVAKDTGMEEPLQYMLYWFPITK